MELPWWVGIIVVAIVAGLVAWQMIAAKIRSYIPWKTVSAAIPFLYYSSGPVDEALLTARVNAAYQALVDFGPWGKARTWAALAQVKVWIGTTDEWQTVICTQNECKEGKVAGQTFIDSSTVAVGQSLAALCHEFAHVVEFREDGNADYEHASWVARGITKAVQTYLAIKTA